MWDPKWNPIAFGVIVFAVLFPPVAAVCSLVRWHREAEALDPERRSPRQARAVKRIQARRRNVGRFLDVVCARNLSWSQLLWDGLLYLLVLGGAASLWYTRSHPNGVLVSAAMLGGLITVVSPAIPNAFADATATHTYWTQYKGNSPREQGSFVSLIVALLSVGTYAYIVYRVFAFVPYPVALCLSPLITTIAVIVFVSEWRDAPKWLHYLPKGPHLDHVWGRHYREIHYSDPKEERAFWGGLLAPWRAFFRLWRRWIPLTLLHLPVLGIFLFIADPYRPYITILRPAIIATNSAYLWSSAPITFEGSAHTKKGGPISSQLAWKYWRSSEGKPDRKSPPAGRGACFSTLLPAGVYRVTASIRGRLGLVVREDFSVTVVERSESDTIENVRLPGTKVVDTGLIAHWRLDETKGTVAHDSVAARDAVVIGNPIWQPDGGKVGGALAFDGVDDFLVVNSPLDLMGKPFSMFAWVKGGAGNEGVLSKSNGDAWLRADGCCGLKTEGPYYLAAREGDATITDGSWHYIGLVWNGTDRILYVDHREVARDSRTPWEMPDGPFVIGRDWGHFWSGLIDDVRIYDRAVKP